MVGLWWLEVRAVRAVRPVRGGRRVGVRGLPGYMLLLFEYRAAGLMFMLVGFFVGRGLVGGV